ncbi:MAG: hypothetical protein KDA53_02210 [Hyphomonas sp.]|nr:hypothetical protein [Hyphomonas sp.]
MAFLDRMTQSYLPHTDGRAPAGWVRLRVARVSFMVLAGLIGAGAGIALDSLFNLFAE